MDGHTWYDFNSFKDLKNMIFVHVPCALEKNEYSAIVEGCIL